MENRFLSRGKRIDNGEWVEGYLIVDEKDYSKYFIGYVFGTNEDGAPHDLDVVQVDPSTICRCTGTKDKSGRLIFEKDIFWHEGEDYVVKWADDSLSWEAVSLRTDLNVSLEEFNSMYTGIIGNGIDNPELLEGGVGINDLIKFFNEKAEAYNLHLAIKYDFYYWKIYITDPDYTINIDVTDRKMELCIAKAYAQLKKWVSEKEGDTKYDRE